MSFVSSSEQIKSFNCENDTSIDCTSSLLITDVCFEGTFQFSRFDQHLVHQVSCEASIEKGSSDIPSELQFEVFFGKFVTHAKCFLLFDCIKISKVVLF